MAFTLTLYNRFYYIGLLIFRKICTPQTAELENETTLKKVLTAAKQEAEAMIFQAEVAEQRWGWILFFRIEMRLSLMSPCSIIRARK